MSSGVRTFGIDVSHHNGTVDWQAALAGPQKVHYAFVKATEIYADQAGVVHQHDNQFDRNWAALAAAGMAKGAYHFGRPDFTADQMADFFFSVYTPKTGDLVPTLDVEDQYVTAMTDRTRTAAQLVQQILGFGARVEAKVGRKPMIYTRFDITHALGNPPEFANFPLWIANYNHIETPAIPKPWGSYTFWQYSSTGVLPGFPPAAPGKPPEVDFNYLNGAPDLLANLTIP